MKKLLLALAALGAASALQGCVPLAVTGAGAAVVMADDRRSTGTYVEDENIEWKALAKINEAFKDAHVNATSYNRKVLLTGEVPNESDKAKLAEAIKALPEVREVANETQVGYNSSFTARGNDSLITTNVKARMVNNGKFSPNHVKVVTEANTVYLMGLVTQAEGDAAAEIARSASGVKSVVKVFEYIQK